MCDALGTILVNHLSKNDLASVDRVSLEHVFLKSASFLLIFVLSWMPSPMSSSSWDPMATRWRNEGSLRLAPITANDEWTCPGCGPVSTSCPATIAIAMTTTTTTRSFKGSPQDRIVSALGRSHHVCLRIILGDQVASNFQIDQFEAAPPAEDRYLPEYKY